MDVKTAIDLVTIWRKDWPETERQQTHMQMVAIALAENASEAIELRARVERAEDQIARLQQKISQAAEALAD